VSGWSRDRRDTIRFLQLLASVTCPPETGLEAELGPGPMTFTPESGPRIMSTTDRDSCWRP